MDWSRTETTCRRTTKDVKPLVWSLLSSPWLGVLGSLVTVWMSSLYTKCREEVPSPLHLPYDPHTNPHDTKKGSFVLLTPYASKELLCFLCSSVVYSPIFIFPCYLYHENCLNQEGCIPYLLTPISGVCYHHP